MLLVIYRCAFFLFDAVFLWQNVEFCFTTLKMRKTKMKFEYHFPTGHWKSAATRSREWCRWTFLPDWLIHTSVLTCNCFSGIACSYYVLRIKLSRIVSKNILTCSNLDRWKTLQASRQWVGGDGKHRSNPILYRKCSLPFAYGRHWHYR